LTSVSHDLRTPLASILGSATSLKGYRASLDDEAQRQLIETIEQEAQRLNRFISDLLDMTRLEAGAVELRSELVDLSDIVGSALRRAGTVLSHHALATDLGPDLPMLKLDPVLFEQVLFNLLDNAAKYAPQGTTISLSAQRNGSSIALKVIDEGDGVAAADLDRIFEKFYRVRAGDRQRAGTGLGLAICRGFVEAMGGTIFAANRRDRRGAVFTIELPIPAQAAAPEEHTA
jgi:two-component system sensor histidine kinase KdpD